MKKYHKHNRLYFTGALLFVLLSSVFAVLLQFYKGAVLDHAVAGQTAKTIRASLILISFILLEVLSYFFFQRFSAKYAIGCISELRQDIFSRILHQSYVHFQTHVLGDYISKFASEAEAIRDRRFRMLPMLWEILFRIILVSAGLFLLDWRIALITILLLTTPLYVPKLIEQKLQRAQTVYLRSMEDNLAKVTDWLSAFEMIKNYAIEKIIRSKFAASNDEAMAKLLHDTKLGAISQLVTTLLSYLSYFIVLVCASLLVLRGDFSAGDFFVAIGMIDQLSYPLISLSGIIRHLVSIKPVCDRMEEFLKDSDFDRSDESIMEFKHSIRFRNVSFSYDGQQKILDGFNLTLEKGKRYLLTGPSGCGKTTVINLLLRYHEISGGQIEMDGMPLSSLKNPYRIFTVMRQDAHLFHDSLRNNLTMYRTIPDSELLAMLYTVGLVKYTNAKALDEMIAENGTNFSGGERKRICLARALLRGTDVLILDEPLANLDPDTAGRIEDALLSIRSKTILIVSHQFTESKLPLLDQVIRISPSSSSFQKGFFHAV